jgi:Flp pilus assembly pilin Flp
MSKLARKRGQNTAEYLIMLTLVSIGSIGLLTAFGKQIQAKFFYLSAALSGNATEYENAQAATRAWSKTANEKVKRQGDIKMEGIDKSDLKSN